MDRKLGRLTAAIVFWLLLLPAYGAGAHPKHHPASAPTVQAGPLDIVGFTLGKPVPECPVEEIYPGHRGYAGAESHLCFFHKTSDHFGPAEEGETVSLIIDKHPLGVALVRGTIIAGNLEIVDLITNGNSSQAAIYASLVEKYGPATSLEHSDKQNSFGAKFQQIDATWNFSNLLVRMEGMGDQTDVGKVSIQTPIGKAFLDANLAKFMEGRKL